MKKYINLAKHLDKLGKYKQADNVEAFIRKAQYTFAPVDYSASGGPKAPDTRFSYMPQAVQTAPGYGQALSNQSKGYGSDTIVGAMPLDPVGQADVLKKYGPDYVKSYWESVGRQMMDDAANTTGIARVQQFVEIIKNILYSQVQDPTIRAALYHDAHAPILSATLRDTMSTQPISVFKQAINLALSINIPEVNSNTIPQAIQEGLQNMTFSTDPNIIQKYNEYVSDPLIKQYAPNFETR
jgi:hypothetical protein